MPHAVSSQKYIYGDKHLNQVTSFCSYALIDLPRTNAHFGRFREILVAPSRVVNPLASGLLPGWPGGDMAVIGLISQESTCGSLPSGNGYPTICTSEAMEERRNWDWQRHHTILEDTKWVFYIAATTGICVLLVKEDMPPVNCLESPAESLILDNNVDNWSMDILLQHTLLNGEVYLF